MALYELRTYQVYVGKMKDAVAAYQDYGWPAIKNGGFDNKLVGYFTSDTGGLHQIGTQCFRTRRSWNLPVKSDHY